MVYNYRFMKCSDSNLSGLEERHALNLLSCLYANGRFQRSALYSCIARTTTAPMKRVNELIAMGLIKETITESAPFTKHVELSEKGRQVAKHVVEIQKILSDTS
jgi:DNA-binding HxlR family transcriptional regulator